MRLLVIGAVGMVAVLTVAVSHADELPQRRPGLWEIRTEGMAMKQCIDQQTDKEMMKRAAEFNGGGRSSCSKNEVVATANGYEISSICTAAGSTITSHGVFSGDFSKAYSGTVTTSMKPPLFGRTEDQTKISAEWLGECGPDLKPGDMVMPNGMKVNMEIAAQQAKKAAEMLNSPEFAKMMKKLPEQGFAAGR
jgi:hypothetical protein